MARSESSRLGELQAEGNLGNERNHNSEDAHSPDGRSRERVRNRSSEDPKREPSGMKQERLEDWSSEWDLGDSDGSASRSDRSSS
jgi:hypothetical protein